jgi:hypothetical protein
MASIPEQRAHAFRRADRSLRIAFGSAVIVTGDPTPHVKNEPAALGRGA